MWIVQGILPSLMTYALYCHLSNQPLQVILAIMCIKGVKPCSKLTRRPWQQEKWVLWHSEQGHYQLYGEDKIFELR